MKTKIITVASEIEASIVKGVLSNSGIESWIAPGEGNLSLSARSRGPNVPYDVVVEDNMITEATDVLKKGRFL